MTTRARFVGPFRRLMGTVFPAHGQRDLSKDTSGPAPDAKEKQNGVERLRSRRACLIAEAAKLRIHHRRVSSTEAELRMATHDLMRAEMAVRNG